MAAKPSKDAEIARGIAARFSLSEEMVKLILDSFYDAVLTEMAREGELKLKPFATFKLKERKHRVFKHAQTGRLVVVPPKRVVGITPSKPFLERAARKFETVVAVGPEGDAAFPAAVRLLEAESYAVARVPTIEAAAELVSRRPATLVLVAPGPSADAIYGFARTLRGSAAPLASLWAFSPDGLPLPTEQIFRVLPTRWLASSMAAADVAKEASEEIGRLTGERGFFTQQASMEIVSTSEAVEACVAFVEERLAATPFPEEERFKMLAAIREAIENGLRHGNLYEAGRKLQADFLADPEKVSFSVRDEGKGFDFQHYLDHAPTGSAVEIARANIAVGKTGGLGIKLLKECVDEVLYTPPGNQVSLTKYFPKGAAEPAQAAS